MNNQRAQEALYESEAALRLVDQELYQLHKMRGDDHAPASSEAQDPVRIVEYVNSEIRTVLARVREFRGSLEISTQEEVLAKCAPTAGDESTLSLRRQMAALLADTEQRLLAISSFCHKEAGDEGRRASDSESFAAIGVLAT